MVCIGPTGKIAAMALGLLLTAQTGSAAVINFEEFGPQPTGFASQEPLDTEYTALGVVFSGGWEILDERSDFGAPARSGENFAAFNVGISGITNTLDMAFASGVTAISIYVGDRTATSWTMLGFRYGSQVASGTTVNPAGGYAEIGLTGLFDRVSLTGSGDHAVADDLSFTLAPVPLPATGFALLAGFGGLLAARRRRRSA